MLRDMSARNVCIGTCNQFPLHIVTPAVGGLCIRYGGHNPNGPLTGSGRQSQKSALCAYCGSGTGTGIFGVSATSIASTLVSLLFASKANGDPKLLAFGDSVQDVAHRAGFIEARSYRALLRQTIAHWLTSQTERGYI